MISTSSSQEHLRFWVCMGDVHQNGLLTVLSLFGESRRPPILTTLSIHSFSSTVKYSPISTWKIMPSHFSVRGIAWRSGWCLFTCAPALGQMLACQVSTSTASEPWTPHCATCSPITTKRLPIPTNNDTGMTRSESVGRTRRHAVDPSSCRL